MLHGRLSNRPPALPRLHLLVQRHLPRWPTVGQFRLHNDVRRLNVWRNLNTLDSRRLGEDHRDIVVDTRRPELLFPVAAIDHSTWQRPRMRPDADQNLVLPVPMDRLRKVEAAGCKASHVLTHLLP